MSYLHFVIGRKESDNHDKLLAQSGTLIKRHVTYYKSRANK